MKLLILALLFSAQSTFAVTKIACQEILTNEDHQIIHTNNWLVMLYTDEQTEADYQSVVQLQFYSPNEQGEYALTSTETAYSEYAILPNGILLDPLSTMVLPERNGMLVMASKSKGVHNGQEYGSMLVNIFETVLVSSYQCFQYF